MTTSRRPSLQLIGTCWTNLGDQLMLESLRSMLNKKYYLHQPIGLYTSADQFWGVKNVSLIAWHILLRSFRYRRYGRPSTILDCSGYQYGDPWAKMGKIQSIRLMMYQYFRAKGGHLILLPQTLGPFRKKTAASIAAGIFQLADLVFARDDVSLQYAKSIGCPPSRLFIKPDYSNIVAPAPVKDPETWRRRVCIVPSVRMLDKTEKAVRSGYLNGMAALMQGVREYGLEPVILVHDLEDQGLANLLSGMVAPKVLLVKPTSALAAKGMIGSCHAVIGSRYHALASALCQSVPAISTGWTHKYRAMFKDYDCEECLLEQPRCTADYLAGLSVICEEPSRGRIMAKLRAGDACNRQRTLAMYTQLFDTLDSWRTL